MIQNYIHSSDFRLIFTSSTSKTNTEFPGIFGGEPLAPYPISGGITNLRFSPSHILKLKMSVINSYAFRARTRFFVLFGQSLPIKIIPCKSMITMYLKGSFFILTFCIASKPQNISCREYLKSSLHRKMHASFTVISSQSVIILSASVYFDISISYTYIYKCTKI